MLYMIYYNIILYIHTMIYYTMMYYNIPYYDILHYTNIIIHKQEHTHNNESYDIIYDSIYYY